MRSFLALLAILPATVLTAPAPQGLGQIIPNKWLVKLKPTANVDSVVAEAASLSSNGQVKPDAVFNIGNVFKGFALTGNEGLLKLINNLDAVESFEPDRVVSLEQSTIREQTNALWGLARIATRQRGPTTYRWNGTAGTDQRVYVIDTGVYTQHNEFRNYDNPSSGASRATQGPNYSSDGDALDRNGHGTHVAGTIAGRTYGVSKYASIIGVKVLNAQGTGSISGIIQGLDWAVNNACNAGHCNRRATANLSIGASYSQAFNDAVTAAMRVGVVVVVAAGNNNANAQNYSPASATAVCTVGATNRNDQRASFSNFGSVLDLFAPGEQIISAWNTGPSATNTISGTSMAAPHVAGIAANLQGVQGVSAASICDKIKQLATTGVLTNIGSGSPNRLLFNGITV